MKHEKVLRLFDTYADDLFRFAVSYVSSKQEAEDIVQNVFLKLITKNIFPGKEYEKPYLIKMTANLCKDYLKSKRVKTSVDFDTAETYLEHWALFTDEEKQLFDALIQLPENQSVPIYLHFYEGYSYKEVAKILKISESAVAMRISRGKDELKRKMEE